MSDPPSRAFPVVALGGSAGALPAFFAFFDALSLEPAATRMAFVVILHLPRDQESHLVDLLRSRTVLPVSAVESPATLAPGQVYVLPPDRTLDAAHGALVPRKRVDTHRHHPVDDIFRALARECGDRTIAIVFSGTGSNGSAALGDVREAGGCVIAQSPDSASHAEMPRNAIHTGFVDMVLDPGQMVPALVRNLQRLRDASPAPAEPGGRSVAPAAADTAADTGEGAKAAGGPYERILKALRLYSSVDFRQYKPGTLVRRINRRAQLLGIADWERYAEHVACSPSEAEQLVRDILITVTAFFRDPDAWKRLAATVLEPLVRERPHERPIRIWVAGCATGEEAYSIAIALFDLLPQSGADPMLELFATDASLEALSQARSGRFPAAAVETLPEALVEHWFTRAGDTVTVRPALRDAITFAPHDLIRDPPFSQVDLVICRNVLIYLKPEIQQRVLRLFHFALREGGALFLGGAESVGESADLFAPLDKAARIWRRVGRTRHDLLEFPMIARTERTQAAAVPPPPPLRQRQLSDRIAATLAGRFAPPAVAIDDRADIIYYHGDTARYLRAPSGVATQNLFSLALEGMVPHLRRLIEAVRKAGQAQSVHARAILPDGPRNLILEAGPIEGAGNWLLVTFVDEAPPRLTASDPPPSPSSREEELQDEVALLREELASTSWSASRTLEETRAYSEEITSMNEELRAANEELETSKEELQSLNEELRTVNGQLRETVSQLRERTADLDNLLRSTGVATLFLDSELGVRWFSPGLIGLFLIREGDIGRPLDHLVRNFDDPALEDECRRVLRTLSSREDQVRAPGGRSFIRRITPYRASGDRIGGLVLTLSDVTEIQNARRYAERIVETVPIPLLVLDTELCVVSANPSFYQTFKIGPAQTERRLIYDLGDGQWNIPELRRLLDVVLPDNEVFENLEVHHEFHRVGRKTMLLSGRRLDHVDLILLVIEDITARKEAEARQAMLMGELGHRVKNALAVVQGLASQTLHNSRSLEQFEEAFTGRLEAYSRAYTQLLKRDWRPGNMRNLIEDALTVHLAEPGRMEIDGPPVPVSAAQALTLSLLLHELQTNAAKYGAFSTPSGRVSLTWMLEDGQVRLRWQECGGPPVASPRQEGFGSILIREAVGHQLDGEVEQSFAPDGMLCLVSFPQDKEAGRALGTAGLESGLS